MHFQKPQNYSWLELKKNIELMYFAQAHKCFIIPALVNVLYFIL